MGNSQFTLALVALGANLSSWAGAPADSLRAALAMMQARGLGIVALSRFWRTPAHPPGCGPDYVNAAAVIGAPADPAETLAILHEIEAALGRIRDGGRWQARGIDLDLIAVGDAVLPDGPTQDEWRDLPTADQARIAPDRLVLPHPRLQDRGFVLAPLAEIAPGWVHPRLRQSVTAMLAALGPEGLAGMAPEGGRVQV